MLLQIHRFPKFIVNISHLQTNDQLCFTQVLFGVLFFQNHARMLGLRLIHECGLYTSLYGT